MEFVRGPTAAEVEVEQTVLGLLFEDADTAWVVLDSINPDDMLEGLHRRIVAAAYRVLIAGGIPAPLTLAAAMSADVGLEKVGGPEYFRHIIANHRRNKGIARELCEALADQAQRRVLRAEIAETESRLLDVSIPAREVLAEHVGVIQALAEGGKAQRDDPVSLYTAVAKVVERLDQPTNRRLIPYGVAGLDDSIGGMLPGDLVIIGARPGMGKTAFGLAVADHVSSLGIGAMFESLEMKNDQLAERWLSMRAYGDGGEGCVKIAYNLIRLNRVSDGQKDTMANLAAAGLVSQPLIIDDRRGLTLAQISVRARATKAKMQRAGTPLGLMVVDHMQLIRADGAYRGNKVAEMTETSGGLKTLAGSLDIPIIALCQLSRAVESREDKRPQLSDLRESGSIEQDADVVILLHRPEYYARKNEPALTDKQAHDEWDTALENSKGIIIANAAKVRHGKEDEIKAACDIAFNFIGGKME